MKQIQGWMYVPLIPPIVSIVNTSVATDNAITWDNIPNAIIVLFFLDSPFTLISSGTGASSSDNKTSTLTSNKSAICFKVMTSGIDSALSHLDNVLSE